MNFGEGSKTAGRHGNLARRRSAPRMLRLTAISLVFMGAVLAWGGETGLAKEKKPPSKTVSGMVFDDAGNFIVGATVELADLQTGKVLDIYSQEDGSYQFAGLSFDHDYKIKAMYKNMSSEERKISSLDTRTRPVFNLTIPRKK